MDWFLYDNGLYHERVKQVLFLLVETIIKIRKTQIFKR